MDYLLELVARFLAAVIVLTLHEFAHAFVAWKCGDPTAKFSGRMSLNPMRHFDPLGALCMLIGGVGWARPVGINPRNYRNPKVGMAISAAAGPVSNFLLAWLSMILYKVVLYSGLAGRVSPLAMFLYDMVVMNLSLAVFNLIPVPPFDGSRIVLLFLPERLYFKAMRYERYIMLAVLALVFLGAFVLIIVILTVCISCGIAWWILPGLWNCSGGNVARSIDF